ncbi:MAG TPA: hypothetical protein VGH77_07400 [Streptosporangiaceae bacterium]|jgi:hypothetical protein
MTAILYRTPGYFRPPGKNGALGWRGGCVVKDLETADGVAAAV